MVRGRSNGHYWGVVLDAPDVRALGRFYAELLDWEVYRDEPNEVTLAAPEGNAYLAVQPQHSAEYARPVWPAVDGRQQMMIHLDVEVGDLDAAVAHAVEMGATLPDHQPQDDVRVLLDPAGHPFCLYVDSS
ncbi:VOC family protein [Actinopolymorpha pittospori]|uniref:Catechol 2,3-dioxygenase-like lactoylglutathione lyase family enzyme n=1 Tax=Actinopolymorpha pittospori TaxID=648752 RepID=A0A927MZ40_9ACTN|nr:VOC family protein [Actinopolymorpha pittospori]MBE1605952.1 catechol 2,3-dioxygenase-like lactoylglutathione lyase family enzyme [Actinopolymorpha pittospori]